MQRSRSLPRWHDGCVIGAGLLVWSLSGSPAMAQAVVPGDFNGDGLVSVGDIEAFTTAILDRSRFLESYPGLSVDDVIAMGDVNGDGHFNKKDIRAFRELIKETAASEIEPSEDFNGDGVVDRNDRRDYRRAVKRAEMEAGRVLFEGLREVRKSRAERRRSFTERSSGGAGGTEGTGDSGAADSGTTSSETETSTVVTAEPIGEPVVQTTEEPIAIATVDTGGVLTSPIIISGSYTETSISDTETTSTDGTTTDSTTTDSTKRGKGNGKGGGKDSTDDGGDTSDPPGSTKGKSTKKTGSGGTDTDTTDTGGTDSGTTDTGGTDTGTTDTGGTGGDTTDTSGTDTGTTDTGGTGGDTTDTSGTDTGTTDTGGTGGDTTDTSGTDTGTTDTGSTDTGGTGGDATDTGGTVGGSTDTDVTGTEGGDSADEPMIRTLLPGPGFTGPTEEPPVARPDEDPDPAYRAAARWDVVPYQTFSGQFVVGVVAFHVHGIDRVLFSVDGGEWVSASEMVLNPRTGVKEYCVKLNASDFADGPVELRAIAIPLSGRSRVVEPLILYANAGGTLPRLERFVSPTTGDDEVGDGSVDHPFASLERAVSSIQSVQGVIDGGVIYLDAADYVYAYATDPRPLSSEYGRWMTIQPMEGVAREHVRFIDGVHPGLWRTNIHLKNVTLQPQFDRPVPKNNGGSMWFQGVEFIGPGYTVNHMPVSISPVMFWTDSLVRNVQIAYTRAKLVRNSRAEDLGEDAFKLVDMVVNSSVDRMHYGIPDWHPDVWQYFLEGMENLIVYGLKAERSWAQGLGVPNCNGCAFVEVDINNVDGLPEPTMLQNFQFSGSHVGVLVERSRFKGKSNFRLDNGFTAADFYVKDSVFDNGVPPYLPNPWDVTGVYYEPEPATFD